MLLVDDVLTSGGTIAECTRTLRDGNASEVRAVVFGKSQQAFERRMCKECERPMLTRRNRTTGKPFWACAGCDYTEEIEGPREDAVGQGGGRRGPPAAGSSASLVEQLAGCVRARVNLWPAQRGAAAVDQVVGWTPQSSLKPAAERYLNVSSIVGIPGQSSAGGVGLDAVAFHSRICSRVSIMVRTPSRMQLLELLGRPRKTRPSPHGLGSSECAGRGRTARPPVPSLPTPGPARARASGSALDRALRPRGGSGIVQVQRDLDVQPAASLRDRFCPRR